MKGEVGNGIRMRIHSYYMLKTSALKLLGQFQ